jgi:hypothetical protein
MDIWFILWRFGIFFPVLVYCTEKNLATLRSIETPFQLHRCPQERAKTEANATSAEAEWYDPVKLLNLKTGNNVMIFECFRRKIWRGNWRFWHKIVFLFFKWPACNIGFQENRTFLH